MDEFRNRSSILVSIEGATSFLNVVASETAPMKEIPKMSTMLDAKTIKEYVDLLGTSEDLGYYICLRVRSGFCCSRCCPRTWAAINEYLYPLDSWDTGEKILIEKHESRLVFRHREAGWEILGSIKTATASLGLIRSIVDLV